MTHNFLHDFFNNIFLKTFFFFLFQLWDNVIMIRNKLYKYAINYNYMKTRFYVMTTTWNCDSIHWRCRSLQSFKVKKKKQYNNIKKNYFSAFPGPKTENYQFSKVTFRLTSISFQTQIRTSKHYACNVGKHLELIATCQVACGNIVIATNIGIPNSRLLLTQELSLRF